MDDTRKKTETSLVDQSSGSYSVANEDIETYSNGTRKLDGQTSTDTAKEKKEEDPSAVTKSIVPDHSLPEMSTFGKLTILNKDPIATINEGDQDSKEDEVIQMGNKRSEQALFDKTNVADAELAVENQVQLDVEPTQESLCEHQAQLDQQAIEHSEKKDESASLDATTTTKVNNIQSEGQQSEEESPGDIKSSKKMSSEETKTPEEDVKAEMQPTKEQTPLKASDDFSEHQSQSGQENIQSEEKENLLVESAIEKIGKIELEERRSVGEAKGDKEKRNNMVSEEENVTEKRNFFREKMQPDAEQTPLATPKTLCENQAQLNVKSTGSRGKEDEMVEQEIAQNFTQDFEADSEILLEKEDDSTEVERDYGSENLVENLIAGTNASADQLPSLYRGKKGSSSTDLPDNIVFTRTTGPTLKNCIRITQMKPEKTLLLTINMAKNTLVVLDNELLPLHNLSEEKPYEGSQDIWSRTVNDGYSRHLGLDYKQTPLGSLLKVTTIHDEERYSIIVPHHSIRPFREKLFTKIMEIEPDFLNIKEVFEFKLEKMGDIYREKITMLHSKERHLSMSIPVLYKSLPFFKFFNELFRNDAIPKITTCHWLIEGTQRYEFIFNPTYGNHLEIQITNCGTDKSVKASINIPKSLIWAFRKQLLADMTNSNACLNCGSLDHCFDSCQKKDSAVTQFSRGLPTECGKCGSPTHNRFICPYYTRKTHGQYIQKSVATGFGNKQRVVEPNVSTAELAKSRPNSFNSLDQGEDYSSRRRSSSACSSVSNTSFNSLEEDHQMDENGNADKVSSIVGPSARRKHSHVSVQKIGMTEGKLLKVVNDEKPSMFFIITIPLAEQLVQLVKTEFIPLYKSMESQSGTPSVRKIYFRKMLGVQKHCYQLAFKVDNQCYYVRIMEFMSRQNKGKLKNYVTVAASQLEDFCQQIQSAIHQSGEVNRWQSQSSNANGSPNNGLHRPEQSCIESQTLAKLEDLQFFPKYYKGKEYIEISRNSKERIHMSMAVAHKSALYLGEYSNHFKAINGKLQMTTIPPLVDHWIEEKDCRYDFKLVLKGHNSYVNITEVYKDAANEDKQCILLGANNAIRLRAKLKSIMAESSACKSCSSLEHSFKMCSGYSILQCSEVTNQCSVCGLFVHANTCPRHFAKKQLVVPQISSNNNNTNNSDCFGVNMAGRHSQPIGPALVMTKNFSPLQSTYKPSINAGIELSLVKRTIMLYDVYFVNISQIGGQYPFTEFQMSAAVSRECLERVEDTLIPFYETFSSKRTDGLTKNIYDIWVTVDENCRFNIVFCFEEGRFLLRITEEHIRKSTGKEIKRTVDIPAECMREFVHKLNEKVAQIKLQTTGHHVQIEFPPSWRENGDFAENIYKERQLSHMPSSSIAGGENNWTDQLKEYGDQAEIVLDGEKRILPVFKDGMFSIKIYIMKNQESALCLTMTNANELVYRMRHFNDYYYNIIDKEARAKCTEYLVDRDFENDGTHYMMRFGIDNSSYFLQIIESKYGSGVHKNVYVLCAKNMESFTAQLMKIMMQTNACFLCGRTDHMYKSCPEDRRRVHCYQCGSPDHFKIDCPDAVCYRCKKMGHTQAYCNEELQSNCCFYCLKPGHYRNQCPFA